MKLFQSIIASLLLTGVATIPASAQSKLNMQGCTLLDRYHAERAEMARKLGHNAAEATPSPRQGAIVILNDGESADCLTEKGFDVISDLDGIATVSVPMDSVEILVEMPQVKSVSMGGQKRLTMYKARLASHVTEAHNGIDFLGTVSKFTGSGVVVGLMDQGLEPNHVNFNAPDGSTRVKRMWIYQSASSRPQELSTEESIRGVDTENYYQTHGTHVAGIMTGSYNGTGVYYSNTTPTTGNIPFYGVAPGADIAMCCGFVDDNNVLDAVKRIIDYAAAEGKPAAINLSLGNSYGPHDGTDAFTQALDRLGKKAIICVSAGNDGDAKMSLEKSFTDNDTELRTFVPAYNNDNALTGIIDLWGSDNTSIKVVLYAYNRTNGQLTTLGTYYGDRTGTISPSTNATIISSGSMSIRSGVDYNNNRFNIYAEAQNFTLKENYTLALKITGTAGKKVNLYYHGSTSAFSDRAFITDESPVEGYSAGTPSQSINGMACGNNTLSVGAYVSSDYWFDTKGGWARGFTEGDIAPYSSYGKRFQGDALPHVCAPGSHVISSYNRQHVQLFDLVGMAEYGSESMSATAVNGSDTDYWGVMDGTSMASPFMTGVAALWLQADKSLTIDDIKDLVAASSIRDSFTASNRERWGSGKVNAAGGLRIILANLASLGAVEQKLESDNVEISVSGGNLQILVPGASSLQAAIYSVNGLPVANGHADGDILTVETGNPCPGIYLVRVSSPTGTVTKKITL